MKAVIDFVKSALRYIGKILGFIAVPAVNQSSMISPENSTEKNHSVSLHALNIKNTRNGPIAEQFTSSDSDKLATEIPNPHNTSVSAITNSTTAEVTDYKNMATLIDCRLGTNEGSTFNDHLNSVNGSIAATKSRSDPSTIKYTTENDSAIQSANNAKSISRNQPFVSNTHNSSMHNWRKEEKECRKDKNKITGRIRLERTRKLKRQSQTDKGLNNEPSIIANSAEQNYRKSTELTNSDEKLINKNFKEIIRNIKCIEDATVKEIPRQAATNESKLSKRNKVIFSMQSLQWPFI